MPHTPQAPLTAHVPVPTHAYYWVDIEASSGGGGGGDSVLASGGSLGKRENFQDAISISPCSRPVGPIAPRLTTQTYHKTTHSLGHTCGSALRPDFYGHMWSNAGS
jgi:hypothetical protein